MSLHYIKTIKRYKLTHWGQDKMDTISQTTCWILISWMKMFEFRLKFHWSLFLRVQLTIFHHWFREWLGTVEATSHCLNQWWLDYRVNAAIPWKAQGKISENVFLKYTNLPTLSVYADITHFSSTEKNSTANGGQWIHMDCYHVYTISLVIFC